MEKEVKALFFAQYYGQKILCIRQNQDPLLYVGFDDMQNNKVRDTDYLLLRKVEQLTDDEAVVLANCQDWEFTDAKDIVWQFKYCIKNKWFNYSSLQYLILIGILLPFTYLDENQKPITLQPSEIEAKGWVKTTPTPIKK